MLAFLADLSVLNVWTQRLTTSVWEGESVTDRNRVLGLEDLI